MPESSVKAASIYDCAITNDADLCTQSGLVLSTKNKRLHLR